MEQTCGQFSKKLFENSTHYFTNNILPFNLKQLKHNNIDEDNNLHVNRVNYKYAFVILNHFFLR